MIIKVLLLVMISLSFVFFLKNSHKVAIKAWKRLALIGLLTLAILAVIFPEIVDDVAKAIGIGRGADLLLYATVVAFIFVTLNIYVKFREVSSRQEKIISHMALLEREIKDDK